jgi:hydrogenase maturation protease
VSQHVVIGVGNAFRGDDAVGLAVAERLRGRVPAGVEVVPCELEPSRLIEAWEGAESALVVDAVDSGAEPGTLWRFDASEEPVPARAFRSSTHALGVGDAIELARALGRLPRRIVVYGVEGAEFAAGEGLTPPVAAAVERTASAVLVDLGQIAGEED